MLCEWWTKHKTPLLPSAVFIPAIGLVAKGAMGFLFVPEKTEGGIGIVEFVTTNPDASPKERLSGWNAVMSGLEAIAIEKGCGSLMSFVAQGKSEEHMLSKTGWLDVTGTPHLIFGKVLCR